MKDLYYILRAFFMGGAIVYRAQAKSVTIDSEYSFVGSCKLANAPDVSYAVLCRVVDHVMICDNYITSDGYAMVIRPGLGSKVQD